MIEAPKDVTDVIFEAAERSDWNGAVSGLILAGGFTKTEWDAMQAHCDSLGEDPQKLLSKLLAASVEFVEGRYLLALLEEQQDAGKLLDMKPAAIKAQIAASFEVILSLLQVEVRDNRPEWAQHSHPGILHIERQAPVSDFWKQKKGGAN